MVLINIINNFVLSKVLEIFEGGACVVTSSNTAQCNCPTGFTGLNCQTPTSTTNPCTFFTCLNGKYKLIYRDSFNIFLLKWMHHKGGVCVVTSSNTAQCNCAVIIINSQNSNFVKKYILTIFSLNRLDLLV